MHGAPNSVDCLRWTYL